MQLNMMHAKINIPASLCSWAGGFESYSVANPDGEDRFILQQYLTM